MAVLTVVEQAYRGTLEEQDDTVLWITHMMKNAGAPMNILLRSNAVNYAVRGQNATGLTIGGVPLAVPPTLDHDVAELMKAGCEVYVVHDDLHDLGVTDDQLIPGVKLVARNGVAGLFDHHDTVWYW